MDPTIEIHDPENEIDIQDLYVFLSVDEQGRKGIVAATLGRLGSTPLMTSQPRVAEMMKATALQLSHETKKSIHLYRFRRDADPNWRTGEQ